MFERIVGTLTGIRDTISKALAIRPLFCRELDHFNPLEESIIESFTEFAFP